MATPTEKGPAYGLYEAQIGVVSGGSIVDLDAFYPRQVEVDPNITTLTFEGNETSQQVDLMARANIKLTLDKADVATVAAIFGKTQVAGLESDEEWAMFMGDLQEQGAVATRLKYTVGFKDESVSPPVTTKLRYTWLNGVCKLVPPQTGAYQAKQPIVLNFVFKRTTEDIAGAAVPNIPSGGAYYAISKLA